jgi:cytochrome c peroxidase
MRIANRGPDHRLKELRDFPVRLGHRPRRRSAGLSCFRIPSPDFEGGDRRPGRALPISQIFGVVLWSMMMGGVARAEIPPPISGGDMVELGRAIFADPSLSNPPGTSCASCHDPATAFSSQNGSQTGLPRGSRPNHNARRTAPSLLYLKYVPAFRFHQAADDPREAPYGGLFWDGRVDTVRDLGRQPLLNPDEMNNRDGRRVAAQIGRGGYAAAFRRAFGPAALDDPDATLAAVGRALEAFLTADEMAPFSSRYDDFIRGRAALTPEEARGLRLFKDPAKGNCQSCHTFNEAVSDPIASMFTDYGYDAVGVPRNVRAPAPAKPDLGLCERRDRSVPSDDPMYCGYFRTPSLRNVAVRSSYMHNGSFTRLRDVVSFYASRGTDPRRWYKSGASFDSLPARYRGRVNVDSPPYNRKVGEAAALDDREIDAIVAFLATLTDARDRGTARRR